MIYLITGGAGFIGSHVVESLLTSGDQVRVFDNFTTGKRDNLPDGFSNLEVIDGDIRDREAVRKAMRGVSKVVHLAALVSVPESIAHPDLCFDINAQGTQIVLDEARRAGVRKVVLASSAAVYGDNMHLPLAESERAIPLSPYGLDKLYAEQLGKTYQGLYGINVTALRFFNVFGPRQDPGSSYSGVISIFMQRMLAGERVSIFGDGQQTRDFVYVKDVIAAIMLALSHQDRGFYCFNVGRGMQVSVCELYRQLCALIGTDMAVDFLPSRAGDIVASEADISAISELLDYAPSCDLQQGLAETVTWYREQG